MKKIKGDGNTLVIKKHGILTQETDSLEYNFRSFNYKDDGFIEGEIKVSATNNYDHWNELDNSLQELANDLIDNIDELSFQLLHIFNYLNSTDDFFRIPDKIAYNDNMIDFYQKSFKNKNLYIPKDNRVYHIDDIFSEDKYTTNCKCSYIESNFKGFVYEINVVGDFIDLITENECFLYPRFGEEIPIFDMLNTILNKQKMLINS